jgi:S-formylglutathione hydrolase FrmB
MGLMHFSFLPQSLGFHTNVSVILPNDHSEGKSYVDRYKNIKPFKTMYLLHGGGGNALDWTRYTSIERYADQYQVAVVMPEVGGLSFYSDMVYGYDYYTYMTKELPMVMECFLPLSNKKEDRLVAGLSMGGYGAFKWAFDQPDFFHAAANLSGFSFIMDVFHPEKGFAGQEANKKNGAVELNWGGLDKLEGSISDTKYMIDYAVENKRSLPKLFAAIGTEDFSYSNGKAYLQYAREKGLEIHYEEMPGQHEWKVWDVMIEAFMKWALSENE